MRHLLIAAAMVVGALFITASASTVIENWAVARNSKGSYEPPTVATSPTGVRKSDAATSNPHRSRSVTSDIIDRAG